jgi:hypothetical protein
MVVKITTTRTNAQSRANDTFTALSHNRERHRKVFTRLNPKRVVFGGAFAEAGYHSVIVDKSIVPELSNILIWCHEQYGDRYAFVGGTFWFLTEEDALFFRFSWSAK